MSDQFPPEQSEFSQEIPALGRTPDAALTSAGEPRTTEPEATNRRLLRAFLATPRGIHIVLMVICFALGFAIVSQVIAQHDDPFDTLSQQDLVVLLEELADREDALRVERQDLTQQLHELEDAATQREAAAAAAEQAQLTAQMNAAQIPVRGPGIRMIVRDTSHSLNASQFVMTIGELRNAGAEAAELNGIRLTMRSSFTTDNGIVYLDGEKLVSPYQWTVIGAPSTLATALEIPGGSSSQMRAKGAQVDITQLDELSVTAVAQPLTPRWAQQQ